MFLHHVTDKNLGPWVYPSVKLPSIFSYLLLTIAQRSQNYVSFPSIHSFPSHSAFSEGWGTHYHREIWFLEFALKKYLTTFWNTSIRCGLDTGLCPYFMKLLIPGNNKGVEYVRCLRNIVVIWLNTCPVLRNTWSSSQANLIFVLALN